MKNIIGIIILYAVLLGLFFSCQKEPINIPVSNNVDEINYSEDAIKVVIINRYNYNIPDTFYSKITLRTSYSSPYTYENYYDCLFEKQADGKYLLMTPIYPYNKVCAISILSEVNETGWKLVSYKSHYFSFNLSETIYVDMSCGGTHITYDNFYDITDSSAKYTYKIEDFGYDTVLYQGVYLDSTLNPGIYMPIEKQFANSHEVGQYSFEFNALEPNTNYFIRIFTINESGEEICKTSFFTTLED
ncbi:MAG: hypothetical protein C0596_10330 [Marinilabiliales bacterium]|nr:MAG: hypothetical protein C0596_10330 [Marinilabiliales bacterium]